MFQIPCDRPSGSSLSLDWGRLSPSSSVTPLDYSLFKQSLLSYKLYQAPKKKRGFCFFFVFTAHPLPSPTRSHVLPELSPIPFWSVLTSQTRCHFWCPAPARTNSFLGFYTWPSSPTETSRCLFPVLHGFIPDPEASLSPDGTKGISCLSIANELLAARPSQFIIVHSFLQKYLLGTAPWPSG